MSNGNPTVPPVPNVPDVPGQKRPGVLVLHAWWGRNEFIEQLCERLEAEGFAALAPDMFDGKIATTIEGAEQLMQRADNEVITGVVNGAVDELLARNDVHGGPIGVIGFSFGAAYALGLAEERPDVVGAAVLYYGTWPRE